MNGSESGRLFQPSMPPVTSPAPAPATSQPPVNRYPPGYSVGSTDIMSAGGGGGGVGGGGLGFHQNININERHGGGGGEVTVKKRGRPRKYGQDGVISPSAARTAKLTSVSNTASGSLNGAFEQQQQQPNVVPPISAAPVSSVPMDEGFGSGKKFRGRPPGSSNKKQKRESFGSAGFGFTPHIIVVQPGEDVLNKIMSFSQNGPRAVCIMSGIGVITNVTLRQAATSGGTATYEGRFDILSLSGSFVLSEAYGQRTRTGGLSIKLSGADGRVFGGVVAGLLVAASPVRVILGSFLPENCKDPMPANHVEPSSVTPKVTPANHGTGPSSSPSHGTMSESSDGPGSSMNRGNESSPQGMASMPWK